MKIMKSGFFFVAVMVMAGWPSSYGHAAGGLDALIEVAKSQEAMQKVIKEETDSYKAVRRSLDMGTLQTGQTQEEVLKECGEPVVITTGKDGTQQWLYKPGDVSHFETTKIYLIFDAEKKLTEVRDQAKE